MESVTRSANSGVTMDAAPLGLTCDELAHFCEHGYVLARQVIDPEIVGLIAPMLQRHMSDARSAGLVLENGGGFLLKDPPAHAATTHIFGQKYRQVIADLCGADRTEFNANGLGYMPIRFPYGDVTQTFDPKGGHVDGIHFHHQVESREQGLIAVELWSDIEPLGGGTAIWAGSQLIVSRLLAAAAPQGLSCGELCSLAAKACAHLPIIECTGKAGDVLLMHPHLYHGSSRNQRSQVRIAGNKCVMLKADMDVQRANPQDLSPVEFMIARALA